MNISRWINYAASYLKESGRETARIDAEVLLAHCTGRDRAALYRDGLDDLPPGQEKMFLQLLERRAGGEPVAYITGHREFMGLDFLVNPAVLIPRPETELLVEKALEILRPVPAPVAVDVGTGNGAIAVSLAVFLESAKIYATDISGAALEVARQNAVRHGVGGRVEFLEGDLLGPLPDIPGFRADLLAANLPYVPSSEILLLMKGVRDFEPRLALDGGPDGLDHYRRLIPRARRLLREGGHLLMEVGAGQGAVLRGIMGPGWKVEVFPDLAGRERLVIAKRLGVYGQNSEFRIQNPE